MSEYHDSFNVELWQTGWPGLEPSDEPTLQDQEPEVDTAEVWAAAHDQSLRETPAFEINDGPPSVSLEYLIEQVGDEQAYFIDHANNVEQLVEDAAVNQGIRESFLESSIQPDRKDLLVRNFGLFGYVEESQATIADSMGISRPLVSHRRKITLDHLSKYRQMTTLHEPLCDEMIAGRKQQAQAERARHNQTDKLSTPQRIVHNHIGGIPSGRFELRPRTSAETVTYLQANLRVLEDIELGGINIAQQFDSQLALGLIDGLQAYDDELSIQVWSRAQTRRWQLTREIKALTNVARGQDPDIAMIFTDNPFQFTKRAMANKITAAMNALAREQS